MSSNYGPIWSPCRRLPIWGGGQAGAAPDTGSNAQCLGLVFWRATAGQKVYARVGARNSRSLRVVEKLGMTREAVLRCHNGRQEERIADVYYGVLHDEWGAAHA